MKLSTCSWVLSGYYQGLRILPPVLTSQILVVFEIWWFIWFFQKNFKKLDFKKFQNEDLSPVNGYCEGTLRGCESCLWLWLLKYLVVFEIWRFLWFYPKFSKNLNFKKFQNFKDLNPVIGNCEGTLRGLQILTLSIAAQILVVFEIWRFFRIFFQNFSEYLIIKNFAKLEIIISVVRLCQGTLWSCEFCLQIGPFKIVQFSRYDVFCDFFKKIWNS